MVSPISPVPLWSHIPFSLAQICIFSQNGHLVELNGVWQSRWREVFRRRIGLEFEAFNSWGPGNGIAGAILTWYSDGWFTHFGPAKAYLAKMGLGVGMAGGI